MSKRHAYLTLITITGTAFVVATIGFGTFAKVSVAGDTIAHAFSEQMQYEALIVSLKLIAPFVLLAGVSAAFLNAQGSNFGFGVFAFGAVPLMVLYFIGFTGSEQALLNRKWTAA